MSVHDALDNLANEISKEAIDKIKELMASGSDRDPADVLADIEDILADEQAAEDEAGEDGEEGDEFSDEDGDEEGNEFGDKKKDENGEKDEKEGAEGDEFGSGEDDETTDLKPTDKKFKSDESDDEDSEEGGEHPDGDEKDPEGNLKKKKKKFGEEDGEDEEGDGEYDDETHGPNPQINLRPVINDKVVREAMERKLRRVIDYVLESRSLADRKEPKSHWPNFSHRMTPDEMKRYIEDRKHYYAQVLKRGSKVNEEEEDFEAGYRSSPEARKNAKRRRSYHINRGNMDERGTQRDKKNNPKSDSYGGKYEGPAKGRWPKDVMKEDIAEASKYDQFKNRGAWEKMEQEHRAEASRYWNAYLADAGGATKEGFARLKVRHGEERKKMAERLSVKEELQTEVKHFRTQYGWAGGRNERTGGTYKHPERIKVDRKNKPGMNQFGFPIDTSGIAGNDHANAAAAARQHKAKKVKKAFEQAADEQVARGMRPKLLDDRQNGPILTEVGIDGQTAKETNTKNAVKTLKPTKPPVRSSTMDATTKIKKNIKEALLEAKRGRPRKTANMSQGTDADMNILVQLRKVIDLRNAPPQVQFNDGTKATVHPEHAKKAIETFGGLRTPADKASYMRTISHSHKNFRTALSGWKPPAPKGPRVPSMPFGFKPSAPTAAVGASKNPSNPVAPGYVARHAGLRDLAAPPDELPVSVDRVVK